MGLHRKRIRSMVVNPEYTRAFRDRLKQVRSIRPDQWEASRLLVGRAAVTATLQRLSDAIGESDLPGEFRHVLLESLTAVGRDQASSLAKMSLSDLTGLPPSKALRALCVEFGLLNDDDKDESEGAWTPERLERFVRDHANPYDLLREVEAPSLLDLGAGDLSFLAEVADFYRPQGAMSSSPPPPLTLHGVDRIRPGSRFGARYQPAPEHLSQLASSSDAWLRFRYWGDQDMCALDRLGRQVLPRYTIVTCHAPASPTFAYEPSRLSAAVIEAHLRATKGASRLVRDERETALEVQDGSRTLLFPPWKFEIRGPLALLRLVAHRGRIGVLSCIDAEVFWELASQLVECPGLHRCPTVLTPSLLSQHLGPAYERLAQLKDQDRLVLGELVELRRTLPDEGTPSPSADSRAIRFRYVEVRRGASFPGIPASRTARLFPRLSAEATPWTLTLVPDRPVGLG